MTTRRTLLGAALALPALHQARAQEAITYLFPAPPFLPAFVPHQLAARRGYYAAEGLNPTFQVGQGGANVATQVGAGNAALGGGVGETTMIVRGNGVPVRAVALLGGRPLYQIAARRDANIRSVTDLRGKRVGVIGFQDTGFFSLLGVLASNGLRRTDLNIQAVGPAGMTQLMIGGQLDAIMSVPEWTDTIEQANIALEVFPIDRFFPAMSQAIMASDTTIRTRPAVVRGFVRAVLRAMSDCIQDPAAAARDYVAHVSQHAGREVMIERIIRRYVEQVYAVPAGTTLGRFDIERVRAVQRFYVDNEIIRTASPVEELFTNDFV